MLAAVLLFGAARAGRLLALVYQSRGGMELGGILTLAAFLTVLIFAVRRRQVSAWRSTVQVLGALVVGNAFALLLIRLTGGAPSTLFLALLLIAARTRWFPVGGFPATGDTTSLGTTISYLTLPAIALASPEA